ncbi:unnamed protein product [Brassica rapa subsp. narinosa]
MGSKWRKAKIALGVNLCLYVPKTLEEESRTSNNAVSLSPVTVPRPTTPVPSSSGLRLPWSFSKSSSKGVPVKVTRPTDYNPSLAAAIGPSQPNPNLNLAAVGISSGSTGGLEGPDRLFVGGLPYHLTEDQIRELLESFGPLRDFNLIKDRETGNSMGYAFCVFQDPSVTDIACAALNGIKMGNKTLTVRRAVQGAIQPKPEQEDILLHAQQQIALQWRQPCLTARYLRLNLNQTEPWRARRTLSEEVSKGK